MRQIRYTTGGNCDSDCDIQLTERQCNILILLQEDGARIAKVIATLTNLSKRTVDEELSYLRKNGFIKKETNDNRSPWVVMLKVVKKSKQGIKLKNK